jgi:aminoglycoside 6'-N-acetyltransferase I
MESLMSTELRKTLTSELEEIARIYMEGFSGPPYNETWTFEQAYAKVNSYSQSYDLYTIKFENEVAGFIVVNPNFMHPGEVAFGEELAIAKEFQGRGLAPIVLEEIFEIYKKRGFKRFIGIAKRNSRPLKLYEKVGLVPSEDDVLVEKKLE